MTDRLLSEDEVTELHPWMEPVGQAKCDGCIRATCKAQDAKTAKAVNEEWVKWGTEPCYKHHNYVVAAKRLCPECWQERKKEIGL